MPDDNQQEEWPPPPQSNPLNEQDGHKAFLCHFMERIRESHPKYWFPALLLLYTVASICVFAENNFNWVDSAYLMGIFLIPIVYDAALLGCLVVLMLSHRWRLMAASLPTTFVLWFFLMSLPMHVYELAHGMPIKYSFLVQSSLSELVALAFWLFAIQKPRSRFLILALMVCDIIAMGFTDHALALITSDYDNQCGCG